MSLELRNITKVIRGKTHIKAVNVFLEVGHFNVLLGATGAGKTSLIKLMAGLDSATSGSIFMDGEDVTKLSTQKRHISLVHQFFVNYPQMTVFDNIASPLKVAGLTRSEIEGRVEQAADILKLRSMLHRRPHELSGGQQQRIALARAIAKESKAVFLDEPLANLDYKLREELRELLPELFAGRGAVVVYATSEPEEALLLGGKTGLMSDGTLRQFGSTAEIYHNPSSIASSIIFSNPPINHAAVIKSGNTIRMGNVEWELDNSCAQFDDGECWVAVRAHHILPQKTSRANIPLIGRIRVTELSGSESSAHFDFENNLWVSLAHGVHPYRTGEEHTFYMNSSACFYFNNDGSRLA